MKVNIYSKVIKFVSINDYVFIVKLFVNSYMK